MYWVWLGSCVYYWSVFAEGLCGLWMSFISINLMSQKVLACTEWTQNCLCHFIANEKRPILCGLWFFFPAISLWCTRKCWHVLSVTQSLVCILGQLWRKDPVFVVCDWFLMSQKGLAYIECDSCLIILLSFRFKWMKDQFCDLWISC